jgi:hypothetical protein
MVNATSEGMVVGFGISDLVVVKTDKVVMVAHKTRVGELKDLLSKLDKDEKISKLLIASRFYYFCHIYLVWVERSGSPRAGY